MDIDSSDYFEFFDPNDSQYSIVEFNRVVYRSPVKSLLMALLKFHRGEDCHLQLAVKVDDDDADIDADIHSNLRWILSNASPRLFDAIMPAIKAHSQLYSVFCGSVHASSCLEFVPRDQVSAYIEEFNLSLRGVARNWATCSINSQTRGPAFANVMDYLSRTQPSNSLPPPISILTEPEQNADAYTENVQAATEVLLCMDVFRKRPEAAKEMLGELTSCRLSSSECQWLAKRMVEYAAAMTENADSDEPDIEHECCILKSKCLEFPLAYWDLSCNLRLAALTELWRIYHTDEVSNDAIQGVFLQTRRHLQDIVRDVAIGVPGLAALICCFLLGDAQV